MSLRPALYTVNNLNQITARDYPGTNDVLGAALATNVVTVNGQTAWRKGEYFWATVKSNNTASAQWEGIKVVSGGNTNNGNPYVPKTPEQFSYDADGNLTNDGRWAYTWDGENRLVGMTVNTNVGPQYQLTFAYDAKGRRIQKLVATNGVAWSTNKFLYDGWNLVAETKQDNSLIRSYVWGTDLSGTSQGAGGVGGLLEISYYGSSTTNCFPAYDGNGNIMALVNAADGTLAANYDYAAFGEPIRITGVMARNNPFRFSTKYADDESDLLYYGYRYYKPSTGTWLNRDPIEEWGGINLYAYVDNDPINEFDPLGLDGAAAAAAMRSGLTYAGEEEVAGLGPEDPVADAAAIATLVGAAGLAAYEYFQPAKPTICEMGHNKPRPSTYDKHTKPRAGGPEKKDPRMQQPPPPRGPKPPPPPKPPEYFKGPKQKNN